MERVTEQREPLSRTSFFVLVGLQLSGPSHGYELLKKIKELSGDTFQPSYPSLHETLTKLKATRAVEVLTYQVIGGRNRLPYQITEDGVNRLVEEKDRLRKMLALLDSALPNSNSEEGANI